MKKEAALIVLALAIGAAAGLLGMWSLALLAPVFLAAFVVWPSVGAATLIAACALDRFAVGVGGPNVRPDELCALALAGALAVRLWWERRAPPRIPLLWPMLAYWGVNVLATFAAGGDVTRGISLDLITLDVVILYAALVVYLAPAGRLVGATYLWVAVAAVEAIVGILAFALYQGAHGAAPGVQINETGAPMVYGTLYEANIFGSYMSAAFLLTLALAVEETARHKIALYVAAALTAVGLVLSATRSAWGSTMVGVILLLVLPRLRGWRPVADSRCPVGRGRAPSGRSRRRGPWPFAGVLVAVAVVVGVGLAVAPASVTGPLGARFQGLLNFASGSGYGRLQLYAVALDEWRAHPWLGLGPGSFAYRLPGDTSSGPAWLPNLTIQVLHDTGVIGLLVLVWLIAAFYLTTLRSLRRALPGAPRAALAGLIAAVTSLLIAFQLTPGFTLGYSWALLALGIGAASACGEAGRLSPWARGTAAA